MGTVMKNTVFVEKLKDIAINYKTLYVMGCFGAPLTAANKKRYTSNHTYNKQSARTAMINGASEDTFGFDCVCLIKGVLWGWNGDKTKSYGGAGYAVNGVPDIGADTMITKCSDISTNFSKIEVGEAVWCSGHIGVYIGDGLAVECTPRWDNKVQITACNCSKNGYNRRNWTKHGTNVVSAVITLLVAVVTTFLIPYLKERVDAEKFEKIKAWVKVAVEAAEMIYTGVGRGEENKAYVLDYLNQKGYKLDSATIDNLIESAVLELKKS